MSSIGGILVRHPLFRLILNLSHSSPVFSLIIFMGLSSLLAAIWYMRRRPPMLKTNPSNCSACRGALFSKKDSIYSVYDAQKRIHKECSTTTECDKGTKSAATLPPGPTYLEDRMAFICEKCSKSHESAATSPMHTHASHSHKHTPLQFSSHYTATEYKTSSSPKSLTSASSASTNAFLKKLNVARRVADVHRRVRYNLRQRLDDGERNAWKLACAVEDDIRSLCRQELNTLHAKKSPRKNSTHYDSVAFPVGININNCAAHFSPNPSHRSLMIRSNDVVSFDIGVQIEGIIIDSAFTWTCDPRFQLLLDACREGAEVGVKHAGVDVYTRDLGRAVQEVVESYEVEYSPSVVRPVRVIRSLCGHCIDDFEIHAKQKLVPSFYHSLSRCRMEANEFFAIEPFASTGLGTVVSGPREENSHFMVRKGALAHLRPHPTQNSEEWKQIQRLVQHISNTYHTLCFSPRSLYHYKYYSEQNMRLLNEALVREYSVVNEYPPLYDVAGSHTAQVEHTIAVLEDRVEILSRGEDY